ncbi:phage tail tube protein [Cloacibacillus evryensis]|uniref:phage tail tube protein n=1 Tax=Cloacibacillus evryensis TaxID=508460 RepID=UPI00210B5ED9|nr:phage tail tube protein [Cloacibacillus evryensis]MCQ4765032.1 phage tail tube protein [Cloacibacillus evryensis]
MGDRKIAGVITLTVDGVKQACAGNFKYNLGTPNRTTLVGQDGVHGFSEEPRAPWIEGDLRNTKGFDVKAFYEKEGIDAQLKLCTGETFVFIDGWVNGDGTVDTKEATIPFRFDAMSAEKV